MSRGATSTVTLTDGWKIGDAVHKTVELRQPTAGDMIEASAAAERVVQTSDGWQLVQSPTRAGIEILKRQIVSIGDLPNIAVADGMLKGLSIVDLEALQTAADALGNAGLEGSTARGRGAAAPA